MDENLRRVFDQVKPSPEQKEAMLRRLLEPERKVKPMRKLKKLTVVGIAAALMVISCAAAVVTGLDQRLLDYFGAKPEDVTLVSPSAVAVGQSHTYENGWTVEIKQVLADRWTVSVLAEVTAPEGTVLDGEDYRLDLLHSQKDSKGEEVMGSFTYRQAYFPDEGPADNHITLLWQLCTVEDTPMPSYMGETLEFTPLFVEGDDLPTVWFKEERWPCLVEIPDTDPGILYDLDQPILVGGQQVKLSQAYVSPMNFVFILKEAEDKLMEDDVVLSEASGKWKDIVLTTRSGETMRMEDFNGISTYLRDKRDHPDCDGLETGFCSFRLPQIVTPEEITSVTLFGQTFALK